MVTTCMEHLPPEGGITCDGFLVTAGGSRYVAKFAYDSRQAVETGLRAAELVELWPWLLGGSERTVGAIWTSSFIPTSGCPQCRGTSSSGSLCTSASTSLVKPASTPSGWHAPDTMDETRRGEALCISRRLYAALTRPVIDHPARPTEGLAGLLPLW